MRVIASRSPCGSRTMSAAPASAAHPASGLANPLAESVCDRQPEVPPLSSVGGGPGLFLDHEIRLDGEDAAAVAEVEQLDQLRIDVELMAVLAEPAGDAEAEALRPIRHPERRVEPGRDQAAAATGASLAKAGHRANRSG